MSEFVEKIKLIESANAVIKRLDDHYLKSDLIHVYKKHKEILDRLAYAIQQIQDTQSLSQENLILIEEAIKVNWEEVCYYSSGKHLSKLAYKFKDAENLFYKLIECKQWKVRLNIIAILQTNPPENVINDLLKKGLCDKSSKVKLKALDIILGLRRKNMIPIIEELYKSENDPKILESMNFSISLLKDGYILRDLNDVSKSLTVLTSSGLTGITISNNDLKIKGIEYIIKKYCP